MNKFELLKEGIESADLRGILQRLHESSCLSVSAQDTEQLMLFGISPRKRTPGFFMLRVRVPWGQISSQQFRAIGQVAQNYGRGMIDLTARGQLQLRWLGVQHLQGIYDSLQSVGLTSLQTLMDSFRNTCSCPVAGVCEHELFDPRLVMRDIEHRVVGNPSLFNLPRKINLLISSCTAHSADAAANDIALVPAKAADGRFGFNVLVGGKISGEDVHFAKPLDVFVSPERAADVVLAIAGLFREHGDRGTRSRARMVYLLKKWGMPEFRRRVEMKTGALDRAGVDQRIDSHDLVVGVNRNWVGLQVPIGRISGDQAIELCRLADQYGAGDVRFMHGESAIAITSVRDVPAMLAEPLLKVLRPEQTSESRVLACTGSEFCSFGSVPAKQHAAELARKLVRPKHGGRLPRISFSGCRAGCSRHMIADIGLVGRRVRRNGEMVDAADVYVKGRVGSSPQKGIKIHEAVPCDELPELLNRLLAKED